MGIKAGYIRLTRRKLSRGICLFSMRISHRRLYEPYVTNIPKDIDTSNKDDSESPCYGTLEDLDLGIGLNLLMTPAATKNRRGKPAANSTTNPSVNNNAAAAPTPSTAPSASSSTEPTAEETLQVALEQNRLLVQMMEAIQHLQVNTTAKSNETIVNADNTEIKEEMLNIRDNVLRRTIKPFNAKRPKEWIVSVQKLLRQMA